MGTEYCLGKHGKEITPQGEGICLMAYEMSGTLDVYVDLPKGQVDMDAWENAARVNLWKKVDPADLFTIGLSVMHVTSQHMTKEEISKLKAGTSLWMET